MGMAVTFDAVTRLRDVEELAALHSTNPDLFYGRDSVCFLRLDVVI